MTPRYLLTTYFLDENRPAYATAASAGWQRNAAAPAAGEDVQQRILPYYHTIADFVEETAKEGDLPVSFAGDCCTTIAVLAGLQRANADPLLIWFDAHGDFNTWETTPSGFLGGMPLAMLVGRGAQTLMQATGAHTLPEKQVILTDGRDLDPAEGEMVAASALVHLEDTADLLTYDLPDRSLWVHFDSDVLRLEDAPAMSYPAAGGPSLDTVRRVMRRIGRTGRLAAVSVSAWNPDMEGAQQSKAAVMDVLNALVDAAVNA